MFLLHLRNILYSYDAASWIDVSHVYTCVSHVILTDVNSPSFLHLFAVEMSFSKGADLDS